MELRRILIITLLFLPFFGCTDNTDNNEPTLDTRLVGTKWKTQDYTYALLNGGECYRVFEFTNATDVENYTTKNGSVVKSYGTYKYSLEYPKLIISNNGSTLYEFTFKDSRTITRDGAPVGTYYSEYIKQ